MCCKVAASASGMSPVFSGAAAGARECLTAAILCVQNDMSDRIAHVGPEAPSREITLHSFKQATISIPVKLVTHW